MNRSPPKKNMACFPCFSHHRGGHKGKKKKDHNQHHHDSSDSEWTEPRLPETMDANQAEQANIDAQKFSFRELAAATKNFRQECLLGEGGFGRVYKGTLQANGQVVAVKQLDRNAMKEDKEFLEEVAQLSHLQHSNLVNLIGYCCDGDQRLLVYEFMPSGSLEANLYASTNDEKPQMDWITRMKIAYGAAQALEYLHKADPPIIYRDLKSSNVLLDEEFNPKLSHIGLDKFGHSAENMPMQSRGMGTYGYSAPEYSRADKLTTVADVYSFGVVLLQLITGRIAVDPCRPANEQNLVSWAQPIFREPKRFPDMADPDLNNQFPERGLNQAVAIAAMCLQDEATARPLMSDVVTALSFLSTASDENKLPTSLPPSISSKLHCISHKLSLECGGGNCVDENNQADSRSETEDDDS